MLVLVLGLAGGIWLDRRVLLALVPPRGVPPDAASQFRLMAEAWNVIERVYVDREALQPRRLAYGAIGGMANALGDEGHSRFLSPEMVRQERDFTQGMYEGIGAHIQVKEGHVIIAAPMDGSPAQQAGLQSGDIILRVDGESIAGMTLDEVAGRIMGPAASSVMLTILTPTTGSTRDVTLLRANISLQNVTWARLPGTTVAHVRIAGFSDGVTQDLQVALGGIREQELTALILDLRNDPGGLLSEAVGVASQFLREGNVLLERDAEGQVIPVPVQAGGVTPQLPMVVLINGGTASAAEIVTGALQDAGRAIVVGEKSFGTGTVLKEFPLSDGSALLLATQEWLTPNGNVIWHEGLSPDVDVSLPPETALLLPLAEQGMAAQDLRDSGDMQLLQALELVNQE
jgi:carboxyl-terminal processing protease